MKNMIRNPKFDQFVLDKIEQRDRERSKSRDGLIMGYNPYENTATVLLSAPDSESTGEIIRNVPCPTYPGIQIAAPEPGRECLVVFKGERETIPMVTHYFNRRYELNDYLNTIGSRSGVPRFMVSI